MTITPDLINRPPHYQDAPHGIPGQPFDYFPYMDGIRSTAFRYVWRAGFKAETFTDLHKAIACVRRDITHGTGNLSDKPGHLTHALTDGPLTLRRRILLNLWGKRDLTHTLHLLDIAVTDPDTLDEVI